LKLCDDLVFVLPVKLPDGSKFSVSALIGREGYENSAGHTFSPRREALSRNSKKCHVTK